MVAMHSSLSLIITMQGSGCPMAQGHGDYTPSG